MGTRINAATRLKADRERYHELEWGHGDPSKHKEEQDKKAKQEQYKKDDEIVNKLREKIQHEQEGLKKLEGPAKEAKQKFIKGLKKRANDIWKKWSLSEVPLYKIGAARRLMASLMWKSK
jgi:hypothetical protein